MNLKEQLKLKLNESIKSGNNDVKSYLRIILGEMDRMTKEPTDDDVLKILKNLKKLECEMLEHSGKITSSFLEFIDSYLPKQITADDIKVWLAANVDFSKLKNKMQAVGLVVKQFGQAADGNLVKEVVQNYDAISGSKELEKQILQCFDDAKKI